MLEFPAAAIEIETVQQLWRELQVPTDNSINIIVIIITSTYSKAPSLKAPQAISMFVSTTRDTELELDSAGHSPLIK